MIKILMGMILFVVFSFAGNESNMTRTVQAKVGMLLSNTLTLDIEWIVDGHVLPPEPELL